MNVLADPSQVADGTATLLNGTKNQIIGRYAFWMDDENSKLNLNTAVREAATRQLCILTTFWLALNSYIYGMPFL